MCSDVEQSKFQADKVPRNRGTARKVIAERNGPVVRREESCARPRVLSQPEIRLYSYQVSTSPNYYFIPFFPGTQCSPTIRATYP